MPRTRATNIRAARGLDLLNFFIAGEQTGFGPFIAVYLTARQWSQGEIGFALTLGTITAMISQVPAGLLIDAVRNKRVAVAAGILAVGASALLLAAWPVLLPVLVAQAAHGFASCVLTPGIAAVSLELVGHAALGERIGRNARFAALGNGLAAGAMGLLGSYVSEQAVFLLTAVLCVPALATLPFIDAKTQPPRRPTATRRARWTEVLVLLTDRRLLVFAACAVLFQMADAAMLPIAAGELTAQEGTHASIIIAACILAPQAVVALLSPWVGLTAEQRGRRPMMLLGWASLPLRGALFALVPNPYLLVAVQSISGISAAVFGVMVPVVAGDVTLGARRFNLCIGIFGLASTAGGALSTTLAGLLADAAGYRVAFLGLAAAGLAGTALVWLAMPETGAVEDAG
jgi:MFS family permease